jgi:glycosyltransferase involved in cell wall biosynthesis
MHILWLDAFHGGSHAAVAQGFARHSRHRVTLLSMSTAGGWRWRMRGAALTFARMVQELPDLATVDLIIATDMLDLATFLGVTRHILPRIPIAIYFHENQLTYPIPAGRKRDLEFPWINYTSMLVADALFFNSAFHRDLVLHEFASLPSRFHDYHESELIDTLPQKSYVLYPGLALELFDNDPVVPRQANQVPTIVWNSRWEYDKDPETFFWALRQVAEQGHAFSLIIAGEHIDPNQPNFAAAREWARPYTRWWGYAPLPADYRALLRQGDIVVSTAIQEFFGIAVLEAMYAGCVPLLPNRLSYPELLPSQLHADCLYNSPEELVEKLIRLLQNRPNIDTPTIAGHFRWETQIAEYDDLFERLQG